MKSYSLELNILESDKLAFYCDVFEKKIMKNALWLA